MFIFCWSNIYKQNEDTDQTEEAGAVSARPAAAKEAENGDRAPDGDEDGGQPIEDDERSRRRDVVDQFDVDVRLAFDPHPEAETEYRTAADLQYQSPSHMIARSDGTRLAENRPTSTPYNASDIGMTSD